MATQSFRINWNLVILILAVIGGLLLWKFFSAQVGAAFAGLLSAFGFGGKGAVNKVRKRSDEKAKEIPVSDPDASIDDINERKRGRRKRSS